MLWDSASKARIRVSKSSRSIFLQLLYSSLFYKTRFEGLDFYIICQSCLAQQGKSDHDSGLQTLACIAHSCRHAGQVGQFGLAGSSWPLQVAGIEPNANFHTSVKLAEQLSGAHFLRPVQSQVLSLKHRMWQNMISRPKSTAFCPTLHSTTSRFLDSLSWIWVN